MASIKSLITQYLQDSHQQLSVQRKLAVRQLFLHAIDLRLLEIPPNPSPCCALLVPIESREVVDKRLNFGKECDTIL